MKSLTWYPRSLVTLTWYSPESLAVTLTNRKVPLREYSSVPLATFFRITLDGGKLMVWQQTVTFCPSWTTVDGRTRTVVFLGGAGAEEQRDDGHMTRNGDTSSQVQTHLQLPYTDDLLFDCEVSTHHSVEESPAGHQLGSVLVRGFTLVEGGVFQEDGGDAEGERGGGGVSPLKLHPCLLQHQRGGRGCV
ncbi:hypothetical protein INR49_019469 [Caranx melampygus]|nr:hypothetical protein INR49_019469 [Caranx melampygus]